MFLSLLVVSCGKNDGNNTDSSFGSNDPCLVTNDCQNMIEITAENMNSREVRSASRISRKYNIGKTYEFSKTHLLNKYVPEEDEFQGNCLVSYNEKRILYKVINNYTDEIHTEPVDKVIYKFSRSSLNLLNNSDICKSYIQENNEDLLETSGWDVYYSHRADPEDENLSTTQEFLSKYKMTLLTYKGRKAVRFQTRGIIKGKSVLIHSSRYGKIEAEVSYRSTEMQFLDDEFAYELYDFVDIYRKGKRISYKNLFVTKSYVLAVDESDIPEDLL